MVKEITVPETPQALYEHAPNQYRPWEPSADGVLPLYTLNSPGAGEIGGPVTYVGAFIPNDGGLYGDIGGAFYDDYGALGMSETAGRMYVTGQQQGTPPAGAAIAEIQIPTLVTGTNINALNVATVTQNFKFATSLNALEYTRLMGIYAVDGQVICGGTNYYTASEPRNYMVYKNGANLAGGSQVGMLRVTGARNNCGWLTELPSQYQAIFGKTHLSGHGGNLSIISGTVAGISMYAVNAADMLAATAADQAISAIKLADWDRGGENIGMGGDLGSADMWNVLSICGGYFVVPGTRTVMAVGSNFLGQAYDPDPLNVIRYKSDTEVDAEGYGGYGGHFAYFPYNYGPFYWLFNLDDLVAVFNGELATDAVQPYEWGHLPKPPFLNEYRGYDLIGGCCYDNATNRVYFAVRRGAGSRFGGQASIGAWQLAGV